MDTKVNSAGEQQPVDERSRYAKKYENMSADELKELLTIDLSDGSARVMSVETYETGDSPYQPQAFASAVRQRLLSERDPDIRKRLQDYLDDVKYEPQISSDMCITADSIGSKLLGYDYRLKNATDERFYQKIAQEPTKRNKDNVRYTMRLGDSVDEYHKTVAALKRKGYKPLAVKNYWLSGGYYKGINTQWESPSGTQFEIQFHSEHNLAVKEELHPLYEQWRKEPPDSLKAIELEARQYEIAKKFKQPKSIDTVK